MLIYENEQYPITPGNAKALKQRFYEVVPFFGSFYSAFRIFLETNFKELEEKEIIEILKSV
jgi:hypothetical protein